MKYRAVIRCPVCSQFHSGEYQMCDGCLETSKSIQNEGHHPDCPKAWHDKASCLCAIIITHHYA